MGCLMSRVFGITGRMGTGKSHAARVLSRFFESNGDKLVLISVDDIRRDILQRAQGYEKLRKDIASRFGLRTQGAEESLDLMEVARAVFATPSGSADLWAMIGGCVIAGATRAIAGAKGCVALEWARLMEDDFLPLVSGRVVVMTCNDEVLLKRLTGGDLPAEQVEARLANQTAPAALVKKLKNAGVTPLIFDTTESPAEKEYEALYRRIRHDLARAA